MLDSAIPGVSSLVIHISDPGPWGLHNQPDNNSNDLTQIINILLHSAAVITAHSPLLNNIYYGRTLSRKHRDGRCKVLKGRQAVSSVLPVNRNFLSSVLPGLPWTVCKQLDQLLWATQAERNKTNTAGNNKRLSLFQYFLCPFLLKSLRHT